MSFLRRPRRLLIRRISFQAHLVCGLLLSLYVSVIGLSGAVLVFGAELHRWEYADPYGKQENGPGASVKAVIANLQERYPHTHVVSIMTPTSDDHVFVSTLQVPQRIQVASDAASGKVLQEMHQRSSRLDWVYDLHENLLSGRKGRVVNGLGAALLLLLIATGLLNWWPGVLNWRRGLIIDFRRRWRRITFDTHSAVGFWSFSLLGLWAISGVYFTWPDRVAAWVSYLSPVVNARPPIVKVEPTDGLVDFGSMVTEAAIRAPGCHLKGLVFPSSRRSPFELLMSRSGSPWREDEDTLYFNPYNGQYISTWHYGLNESAGDWFIELMMPLHFGTHWGMLVKIIWASFGLALPVLAFTGATMYWNRVLSKQWKF